MWNEINVIGVRFKLGNDIYIVEKENNLRHEELRTIYGGYSPKDVINYFNNNTWIPLSEPVINYEVY